MEGERSPARDDEDERAELRRRLVRLDARGRLVLSLRYGLGGEPQTLKEIGGRLGMTREWVLERRALARLAEA